MAQTGRWRVNIVGHAEVDPRTIQAHALNPKIHTGEQDAVVEASLREFGWLKSVIINLETGHLLDGHERVELALLREEATVPVEYVRLPESQEPAALLVLDPSGTLARTHVERWRALQTRAQGETAEPALLAFWAHRAAEEGIEVPWEATREGAEAQEEGEERVGEDEDRGARLQAAWETAVGQIWRCGDHVVHCSDCTTAAPWDVLRDEVGAVQGCITSPPYAEQRAKDYGGIPAAGYVAWFWPVAAHLWDTLAADGSFFLNLKEHSEGVGRPVYVHKLLVELVEAAGWQYVDEFCWERAGVPGDAVERGKFKNQWEPVFWLAKQVRPVFHPERARHRSLHALAYGPEGKWNLARQQGTGRRLVGKEQQGPGWAYPGNRLPPWSSGEALGHPGAFPVGLPQFFVEVYSDPGDWWVDPFGGSGTTLMACEATGRQAWLMERDPRYVAITLERYQRQTGERPRRGATS